MRRFTPHVYTAFSIVVAWVILEGWGSIYAWFQIWPIYLLVFCSIATSPAVVFRAIWCVFPSAWWVEWCFILFLSTITGFAATFATTVVSFTKKSPLSDSPFPSPCLQPWPRYLECLKSIRILIFSPIVMTWPCLGSWLFTEKPRREFNFRYECVWNAYFWPYTGFRTRRRSSLYDIVWNMSSTIKAEWPISGNPALP